MSIGIGRKRTFGLAIESSYGVAEASPTFYLSQVEPLVIEEVVTVAENQANLGSSYETDETYNAVRYANITLNAKLDEDSFPALLAQNFDISSVTATGESAVYEHELTFNSNNQLKSFTLFLDDDDRESELIKGLILNGINLIVERKGIRVEASGVGFYPSAYGGNVTVTQPKHFVGRKTQFELTTNTGTLAVYNVLTLQLNHTFNITGEDDNFYLNSANGDLDLDNVFTTGVRFEELLTTQITQFVITGRLVLRCRQKQPLQTLVVRLMGQ